MTTQDSDYHSPPHPSTYPSHMPHPHSGASAAVGTQGDVAGDDGVTSTTSWNITGQCSNSPYTGELKRRGGGGGRGRREEKWGGGWGEGGREVKWESGRGREGCLLTTCFFFPLSVPASLWHAWEDGNHCSNVRCSGCRNLGWGFPLTSLNNLLITKGI
jgi:hypothetical protein